ncbi:MBL fold metallo-hydrolase [Vibrio algarum]|uniref:MBL fold metallo-hydrolase n=1 Tax=Vibrio algarum TaxID=3020714 RepID=A0ABT4YVC2_9VIBR|nr:MBL fold metallo-hydrolase [Vibrio sp. KJ40-1]MDB1125478.1 MBL fold metallo-hydrolase [Vibrio sp. KJ40-1]
MNKLTSSDDRSFLRGETNGGVYKGAVMPIGEDSWKSTNLGGIYALEVDGGNPGGNLGLLIGDDGIVLIDNGLEKAGQMTLATTQKMADDTVNFVINTHLHADHLACNPIYSATGAKIIAHDNTRSALLADSQFDKTGLPNLTFNDTATFYLNGQTLKLLHIPKAHTNSDIIIHFSDANIIHAGDMFFNKVFPFIDLNNGGNIDGFIAGQQQVIELANEKTVIIPGHGPLGSKADMQEALDMLINIKGCIKPLVEQGLSMEEVLRVNPLADFENWAWFHISIERMTKILYCLLTEGQ